MRYLPLPKSTKEEVSLKMIMGVPAQNILQGVLWNLFYYLLYEVYILDVHENIGDRENRESFDQTVSRRHFISRADVNNVRVKVQHNLVQRHKDDATSVSLFISELQHESFSPVVVFKPQGEKHPKYPNISKEAFVLVIQTKFQLQLNKKHAPTIMCIDSTHGTNQYRFKLITMAVPDEHGKGKFLSIFVQFKELLIFSMCSGQPVGWCIADNESSDTIELFLGSIRARSPETSVGVIMTDDGNISDFFEVP